MTSFQTSLATWAKAPWTWVLVATSLLIGPAGSAVERWAVKSSLNDIGYNPIRVEEVDGLLMVVLRSDSIGGQEQILWMTRSGEQFVAGQVRPLEELPRGRNPAIELVDPLAAPAPKKVSSLSGPRDASAVAVSPPTDDDRSVLVERIPPTPSAAPMGPVTSAPLALDQVPAQTAGLTEDEIAGRELAKILAERVTADMPGDRYLSLLEPQMRPTPASYKPPKVRTYGELASGLDMAGVITVGSKGKVVTVFVDALDTYSFAIMDKLQPRVDRGEIQLRLVPIAVTGKKEAHKYGAVLALLGKWMIPEDITEAEVQTLTGPQIIQAGFSVAKNTMIAGEIMGEEMVTPAVLVRPATGPMKLHRGAGNLDAYLATAAK